jgi:hypothetical protein
MSTFPVYHGITLAENSWVENLNVEILASDPVPLTAGRIWYNSTDKVFRQSTLNAGGAVVVRSFATVEELSSAVSTINAAIASEAAAREAADSTLQSNIDTEASTRAAADTTLQGNIDAEAAARAAADTTLQGNIDAEAAARAAADTALQTSINNEVTARTAADTALQTAIDNEVTARTSADTALQTAIDSEVTARTAADTALQTAIDSEAAARTAADSTLQSNIDAVDARVDALGNAFNYIGALTGGATVEEAVDLATLPEGGKDSGDYYKVTTAGYFKVGAGAEFFANVGDGIVWNTFGGVDKIDNSDSNVSGTTDYIAVGGSADTGFVVDIDSAFKGRVSTLESGLASEITARASADTTLQSNIDAEASARATADTALQTAINNEVTARSAADTTLQSNIDAEAAARAAADTTLQSNIDAEATARAAADSNLQSSIGTLSSLTTTEKSNLVGAVNELNGLLAGGTADLRSDYNATIFTYESTTAGTTHTIAHGLNSGFVDFSVMIQRADGKWYNDIASIAVVDANNATLYLSTALNVKAIARSATTI